MAAWGLFPEAIMARFMNTGAKLGSSIAAVITATIRMSLWQARPAISLPYIALHCRTIHFPHENGVKSQRRTYQTAYCDADSRSQITGRAYNQKPFLLADGQPTNVVRDTWTHLGHHNRALINRAFAPHRPHTTDDRIKNSLSENL